MSRADERSSTRPERGSERRAGRPEGRLLFAYGSLELPEVMEAVTGLRPASRTARLPGYRRRLIHGEVYPGIVPDAAEATAGTLYEALDAAIFEPIDAFEGEPYRRESVQVLCAGDLVVTACTYVLRGEYRSLLSDHHWDLAHFRVRHLPAFLETCRGFRRDWLASVPWQRSLR